MKALLTPLLMLSIGLAHAQVADSVKLPIDPTTHHITYADVVQMPGVSQAELYTRAKLWFADSFKSGKEVIQADEKDAGIVQGQGWSPVYVHFFGRNRPISEVQLWYTVKLACRDGRYRYEITEFKSAIAGAAAQSPIEDLLASWSPSASNNATKKTQNALITGEFTTGITSSGSRVASSLQSGMARKPAGGKDW